ncbi:MAG: BTAD domain-containing putative transcriptional regulator [Myxococcota bacterium]
MPGESDTVARQHAELTDAVARGRLALAEIAAIPPCELDAMFELGAECLDTGREEDAVDLLAGLVALFPYTARYWRAYAIALHRCLELERARAAYEAALLLEPGHELTRCYRAEILFYIGAKDLARTELEALRDAKQSNIAERATDLLGLLDALAEWEPKPRPPLLDPEGEDDATFMLDEDRSLPLLNGRFDIDEDEPFEPTSPEITNTARIFAPVADPTSPDSLEPTSPTLTETALIRVRQPANPQAQVETTETADAGIIGRRGRAGAGSIDTGLLPGRGRHRVAALQNEGARPLIDPEMYEDNGLDDGEEVTHTAIFLRRTGVPMCDEPADARIVPASGELTQTTTETPSATLAYDSAEAERESSDVGFGPPTYFGPPVRIGSAVKTEVLSDDELEPTEIRSVTSAAPGGKQGDDGDEDG